MFTKTKVNLKVIPDKGKKEKAATLLIGGELSIENSSKVKTFLVESLKKYQHITIRLSDVSSIDLSILQLLQRFLWDATAMKKDAGIELNITQEIEAYLKKTGFKSFVSMSSN